MPTNVSMNQRVSIDPTQDILRVSINVNGKFDIVDFTTPTKNGRVLYRDVGQENVPTWIIEAISMLRIAEPLFSVESVGYRVGDKLYYIIDKRGEYENQIA